MWSAENSSVEPLPVDQHHGGLKDSFQPFAFSDQFGLIVEWCVAPDVFAARTLVFAVEIN
jgi:hypothetical protein